MAFFVWEMNWQMVLECFCYEILRGEYVLILSIVFEDRNNFSGVSYRGFPRVGSFIVILSMSIDNHYARLSVILLH
jgi:hypothetical protein